MRVRLVIGIIVVIAVVVGLIFGFNFLFHNVPSPIGQHPKSSVVINKQTFYVTLAKSDAEKELGLSGKSSLPSNQGMLFLFTTPDYYAFWMKNMKFPIDIIYINGTKIVTIFSDVPYPKSAQSDLPIYKPSQPADKVLEINAGLAKKYKMKEGNSVQLHL